MVNGVSVRATDGACAVADITFELRTGEIVGVAGVSGNGQTELLEAVLGLRPLVTGEIHIAGDIIDRGQPVVALLAGAVDVPEDPVNDAVDPGPVGPPAPRAQRPAAPDSGASGSTGRGAPHVRRRAEWRSASRWPTSIAGSTRCRAATSSGCAHPHLPGGRTRRSLVVAYPSRGLDIASVRATQQLLLERRAAGVGVLMVSEDLDELLMIADRIVVLHDGHVAGIVDADGADRQTIGRLMLEGAAHADQATEPAA